MNIIKRITSSFRLRNLLEDFCLVRLSDEELSAPVPYFQYKIGPREKGFILTFSKQPNALQYQNEVFRKAYRFPQSGVTPYLNFHFQANPDKQQFLDFLHSMIRRISAQHLRKYRRKVLNEIEHWVKKAEEQLMIETRRKEEELLRATENENSIVADNRDASPLLEVMTAAADRLATAAPLLPRRDIEFGNPSPVLLSRFMVHAKIIANLLPGGRKAIPLLNNCHDTDLSDLLRHFQPFKHLEPATLQKNIREAYANSLKTARKIRVEALEKELIKFYYE